MNYKEYTVKQGDTWDVVAWTFYNDPQAMEELIRANPHIPLAPYLPFGERMIIPERSVAAPTLANSQVPPWRQR